MIIFVRANLQLSGAPQHIYMRSRDLNRPRRQVLARPTCDGFYRVRALSALGLSLEEIAGVLAGTADDLGRMRGLLAQALGFIAGCG
jgi:hypothetical protein